jgi:hypothetical protein
MKTKQVFVTLFTLICLGIAAGCSGQSTNQTNVEAQKNTQISANLMPSAVLVNMYNANGLELIGLDQAYLSTISIDNSNDLGADNVVPAGKLISENADIPLVYTTYSPEVAVMLTRDGQTQVLRKFNSLGQIAGSNGQEAIAYSEVAFGDYSLNSFLYVGNLNDIGFSTSVYQMQDYLKQWVLAPLFVEVADGQPSGVWYTTSGWGVGGPGIFFPITQGLYYYDIAAGTSTEYLGTDQSLQGLSPDRTMAGSIASSSYSDHDMTVTNLVTHWTLQFPLRAASDQGSGYATFAPDNQHVAWLEVGTSPYDEYQYNFVVRVGSLSDGNIDFEIDNNAVAQTLQNNDVTYIQPVGWLDADSLLIEAHGSDWQGAAIVRLSLSDHNLYQFSKGAFVNFIY